LDAVAVKFSGKKIVVSGVKGDDTPNGAQELVWQFFLVVFEEEKQKDGRKGPALGDGFAAFISLF
jgi:hypothetical protein